MITELLLFLIVDGLSYTSAQYDPFCLIKGPAAAFYKIDSNNKEVIKDGSSLDSSKITYIVIHGWTENSTWPPYEDIGRELSATGNVLLVDYHELASKFFGTCAYYMVNTLGNFVAKFIKDQSDAGYMNPSQIHIIGHSVGGQAAGKIGREVYKMTGAKIKRISALDPAGPFYALIIIRIPGICLGPSDAEMVDVLHTTVFFGALARMGTVDFYARNRLGIPDFQPSCDLSSPIYCSHIFSKWIFFEAIKSCGFIASKDFNKKETLLYGMHMALNETGAYSFATNKNSPYAMGNPACP